MPCLFSNPDISRYRPIYYYNNTATNHTELTLSLIASGEYDLITLVGYELRRGFDISEHPDQNFLFYDLAGLSPHYSGKKTPDNLMVVSFNENETGYIAGALTVATISPLPNKIGIIGTYRADHRWASGVVTKLIGLEVSRCLPAFRNGAGLILIILLSKLIRIEVIAFSRITQKLSCTYSTLLIKLASLEESPSLSV